MCVFVSWNRKELKGRGRRKKKGGQQLREGPGWQEEVDQLKQGKQMTRRWELGGAGCERKATDVGVGVGEEVQGWSGLVQGYSTMLLISEVVL